MDVKNERIQNNVNHCQKCHKSKRKSYSCSYNVYESIKNEHIKAINHYSYTSPVKAKVLNLYNKNSNKLNNNDTTLNGSSDSVSLNGDNTYFKIHQLVPNTGPAHGGIQVTIYGQGFYDGLYVVYGNCIIETEFIDSNTITFYLPPNPKCFHYNGKKTVVEDLFVVDLYKSLISHAEFNTNISDSFNIMLEIIIKIVITRVCNNFNDLSFMKPCSITNNSQLINGQKQNSSNNFTIFNTENNYLLNSLKSLQNSISCSFTQQEKALSSLINKTKEFIPTFYITNNRQSLNTNSSNDVASKLSTTTPVIKININPSISIYQPYYYPPNLLSTISNVQTISFLNSNSNLNFNFNTNSNSNSNPKSNSNPNSNLNCNTSSLFSSLPIHYQANNNNTNNNNISLFSKNFVVNPLKPLSKTNNNMSLSNISNTTNLSQNVEDMAIEGDDEMEEDNNNNDNNSNNNNNNNNNNNKNNNNNNNNNINKYDHCTCNKNVGIIPKTSNSYSYKNSKKQFKERVQEIRNKEEAKKKEHQQNYKEGKKIEQILVDCVKKSNESNAIQPNEFLYSSTTSPGESTSSLSSLKSKSKSKTSSSTSSSSFSTSSTSSKRSITIKITLIHLGIILCMTRLIYYILKYCKLYSRLQNFENDVSSKMQTIKTNVKRDNLFFLFSKNINSNSNLSSNFDLMDENDNHNINSSLKLENESKVFNHNNYEEVKEKDSSSSNLPSSPSSSPTLSPTILTPSSSSNDYQLSNSHNNDTQLINKSSKTKKRSNYLKIIDQGDTIGNTPLHYATIAHSPALFNMLIEAGANINKENIYGQTVLDLAYSIGDDTMVELIEEIMNNNNNNTMDENESNPSYSLSDSISSPTLVDSGFSSGMNEGLI